ncbi:hypothetical protein BSG1_11751 [Bacillus sp. SG-1]|nr:hypothetical protein BSG1_11751 [Bacillus sp. SG-1]
MPASAVDVFLFSAKFPVKEDLHLDQVFARHDGIVCGPINIVDKIVILDSPEQNNGVGEAIETCLNVVSLGVTPFIEFHGSHAPPCKIVVSCIPGFLI